MSYHCKRPHRLAAVGPGFRRGDVLVQAPQLPSMSYRRTPVPTGCVVHSVWKCAAPAPGPSGS